MARLQVREARRTQAERRASAEDRLIQATLELIAQKGMGQVTMGEIGQVAGFSRGLAAHHFGSKAGLLAAVSLKVRASFGEIFAASETGSGLDAIMALTGAFVDTHESVLARAWNVIIAESVFMEDSLRTLVVEWIEIAIAQVADRIKRGIEDGSIRKGCDPRRQAIIMIGALRGIASQGRVDQATAIDGDLRADILAWVRSSLAS
jgi:AcrR family transcriptional regulator